MKRVGNSRFRTALSVRKMNASLIFIRLGLRGKIKSASGEILQLLLLLPISSASFTNETQIKLINNGSPLRLRFI